MNNKKVALLLGVSLIFFALLFWGYNYFTVTYPVVEPKKLWSMQCIDTMKVSRDRARELAKDPLLEEKIQAQVKAVSSIGATCISLGTPYDDEFIPYLSAWVRAAREEGLSIWFRGNFSGWEGWFDYPRIRDTDAYLTKVRLFLVTHQDLFEDGDIFTATPEAENGGPFIPGNASQYGMYRAFLAKSYTLCTSVFADANKKVVCNWFSMSGGHAKAIFTKPFAKEIGNVVTIDHYVPTVADMESYIHYFAEDFDSQVVLGEFGAPIPDINGPMTEDQQREFVDSLLQQLYRQRDVVDGLNYWTLTEGSTRLLQPDGTERSVVQVLRNYYQPGVIVGRVVNMWGMRVQDANIQISDLNVSVTTDSNGYFVAYVPAGNFTLIAFTARQQSQKYSVVVPRNGVSKIFIHM